MIKEIFHRNHNSWEEWLYAENGQLSHSWENDGWAAIQKGIDPHEEMISLEEALRRWPQDADKIRAALEESKGPT